MYEKGSIVENVEITGIGEEGKAVARVDNFVIFVEDAVPGDVVDVRIFRKKKNFAEGKAVVIQKASPDRTEPFCRHFGTCGGCKWQHLSYEKQLAFKQKTVIDAFERIGKINMPGMMPILGSEKTKHYRNKLEYTFSNRSWLTKDEISEGITADSSALGFHVPLRFDKILDIKTCFLQDDLSNAIRLEVRDFCLRNSMSFFDLNKQEGDMRNLIIRNTSTGEWMVIIVFHGADESSRNKLLEHMKNKFPLITSLQYIINTKRNDTIFDQEVLLYHGSEYITERMENLTFRISAKSFYQTNSYQAFELYKIARNFSALTGNENVYDLYTGTGTIASFISSKAKHVYGIDYIEDAIRDARVNAADNNLKNISFFAGDMKDVLNDNFINKNGKPDVIITDPPRAGMHEEVVKAMLKADPKRIVYVSCNPSTQARDLQLMDEAYRIEKIQAVDMFPHTSHVENVVLLNKRTAD
jgi:23S rRNA (uracil1939-C5)-methyltransferase